MQFTSPHCVVERRLIFAISDVGVFSKFNIRSQRVYLAPPRMNMDSLPALRIAIRPVKFFQSLQDGERV